MTGERMNFFARIMNALRRRKIDNELNDEMRFHLEQEVEQNLAAGMSPEEARRKALVAFGGVQQTRESYREVQRGRFWEGLLQDLRYGWRMLRKSPVFTLVAVSTLALGIGANTAIFSLIDAVLFRKMPVQDPQNLLVFHWQAREGPKVHSYASFGDCNDQMDGAHAGGCSLPLPFFRDVKATATEFSHVTAYTGGAQLDLSDNGPARMVRGQFVSGDYFGTLGVRAHLGRLFAENDDVPGAPPAVVLHYGLWQTAFGASPSAIGKVVRINGSPFTIIGVAEPRFDALSLASRYELWLPLVHHARVVPNWSTSLDAMDSYWLVMIGRVKPGVSPAQAQAGISLRFRNAMLHGDKPVFKSESDPQMTLGPAQELGGSQGQVRQPLYIMLLCVGVVLMIACANVAGLLLARSATRQREMAVRLALGARRGRLIRQLLTESVMLSALGGALGLLLAVWGARAMMALAAASDENSPPLSPQLDWRVLAFTAGVSILTGILFGLAPALRGSDVGLTTPLRSGEGLVTGAPFRQRRFTAGSTLVALQMALAIVVLVTAGLLVRTLGNLKKVDPGFDTRNVLLFGVDPRVAGYQGAKITNLYQHLQERLSALPGVLSASYSEAPLLGGMLISTTFRNPRDPSGPPDNARADNLAVGPGFFRTMGIRLLSGRDFKTADFDVALAGAGEKPGVAPTPAIVNQMFVQKYFPGRDPLGQIFADEPAPPPGEPKSPGFVIVGTVSNAKYSNLRRAISATFYVPNATGATFFELRTATDPNSLIAPVRKIVSSESADLALFRVATQQETINRQMVGERLTAQLSSAFGLLALVLACMGLYGLLAYEVTRRTREIGIRMAIGAQAGDVIRLVLGRTMVLALVGAAAGIVCSLGVARALKSALYGVAAGDPVTLFFVLLLLVLVALTACIVPARRAARVDPLVALRYE